MSVLSYKHKDFIDDKTEALRQSALLAEPSCRSPRAPAGSGQDAAQDQKREHGSAGPDTRPAGQTAGCVLCLAHPPLPVRKQAHGRHSLSIFSLVSHTFSTLTPGEPGSFLETCFPEWLSLPRPAATLLGLLALARHAGIHARFRERSGPALQRSVCLGAACRRR